MRDLARHSSVFLHEMCGITLQRVFQFHWRHQFFRVLPSYSIVVSIVNCYWIHFPNGWCVLCMSVILSSLARRGMTIAILQFAFIDSLRWHWTNIQLRQYLGSELTRDTPQVKVMDRPTNQQTDIGVPIAKKNADWKPKSTWFYNPAQAVRTQSSAEVYLTLTKFIPPVLFSEFTSHLLSPSGTLLKQ